MTNLKQQQQQQQQEQEYKVIDFNNFVNKAGAEYNTFKKYYKEELEYSKEELAEAHADAVVDNFNRLSNKDRFVYVNEYKHKFFNFLRINDYVIDYHLSGEFSFLHIADFSYDRVDYIVFLEDIMSCMQDNNVKLSKELCKDIAIRIEDLFDDDGLFLYNSKKLSSIKEDIYKLIKSYK